MSSTQKEAYERLKEILLKIEAGAYGKGDDVDLQALRSDLDASTFDLD